MRPMERRLNVGFLAKQIRSFSCGTTRTEGSRPGTRDAIRSLKRGRGCVAPERNITSTRIYKQVRHVTLRYVIGSRRLLICSRVSRLTELPTYVKQYVGTTNIK